ncbi:MAG: plasmid pRiA4b ORF-3 family protein [Bacteroidales bacterium]|jgi:hypothetical protein|nr:plasmid pRiA4b ORF-3 family protein [Bacteroidales bacterium]
MYTYKFRLLFDEVEDFVRDYEILAGQTFQDFHNVIIKSITGLNDKELASFYVCDRRWEKKTEITLIDMEIDKDDDDTGENDMSKMIMSECVLSEFIDDPHQRLIYEYDFFNLKTFYIELLKTYNVKTRKKYPQCVYAVGEMPLSMFNLSHEEIKISHLDNDISEDEETKDYYDEEDMRLLNDDIEI